jgi:hypothetical protein
MTKRKKKIREKSLVRYDFESMPKDWTKHFPFKANTTFVYLGEILQARGHGIFVETKTGKAYIGYHTDEFIELTEEEA